MRLVRLTWCDTRTPARHQTETSRRGARGLLLALAVVPLLILAGCGTSARAGDTSTGGTVNVAYAGSLVNLMEKTIGPGFAKETGYSYQGKGAGSTALATQIAGGLLSPDVFISVSKAAYSPLRQSAHGNLAPWYITFGSTAMVIGYCPKSKYAAQLADAAAGKAPWYSALETPGLLLGRTDPKLDPKGINTLLTLQLAESYYAQPGLSQKLLGDAENTAQIFPEETLVSRLQTGQLDAGFFYLNEVRDAGLPYISLPEQINLSNPSDAATYAQASFTDSTGKTTTGAPIVYTVTILSTASNKKGADAFVHYLLAGAGHTALTKAGILSLSPTVTGNSATVPSDLKSLVS